jgi:3-methyladenine DNA glycosylase/8-oxoguanine DNA glycosylase
MSTPAAVRRVALTGSLDLVRTLSPLRRASRDPTIRLSAAEAWRATLTPLGAATEHLTYRGSVVEVEAWGPGAEWVVEHAPDLVGAHDRPETFRPENPLLRDLARRFPGLRIGRSSAVLEALVPSILEQKVPGAEARTAFARLARALGEVAPGPRPDLRLPPAPDVLARTPYETYHRFGVDRRRSETVRRAATYARRIQECATMPVADATRRLRAIPGIGEWTAAEVAAVALGDPDAVSLGDYGMPHMVSYALAGEPRGTDARMVELLEPYRGHRARVIRLLSAAGIDAPRRGPRLALNSELGFGHAAARNLGGTSRPRS